jgi:hypothetical protein
MGLRAGIRGQAAGRVVIWRCGRSSILGEDRARVFISPRPTGWMSSPSPVCRHGSGTRPSRSSCGRPFPRSLIREEPGRRHGLRPALPLAVSAVPVAARTRRPPSGRTATRRGMRARSGRVPDAVDPTALEQVLDELSASRSGSSGARVAREGPGHPPLHRAHSSGTAAATGVRGAPRTPRAPSPAARHRPAHPARRIPLDAAAREGRSVCEHGSAQA